MISGCEIHGTHGTENWIQLGILTVYTDPKMASQSVPALFMVQKGVGTAFFTPIISILIILGAVTTAVNMVAAMVKRIGTAIETPEEKAKTDAGKPMICSLLGRQVK